MLGCPGIGTLAHRKDPFKRFPEKAILNLSFETRKIADTEVVVGAISGSIDANTLPKFRAQVESYLTEEPTFLIIDGKDLRYVNSSGMGILIKLATEFSRLGGQYAMCAVPAKIMNLFKMLGILDVLKTYPDMAEAMADMKARFGKAAPPAPPVQERRFPLLIQCIGCRRRIEIASPGYFSCPRCATYFSVKKEGKIKGYKIDKPLHAELTLPASPEMAQGLREVAAGLAALRGFTSDAIQRIRQFLDETATILSMRGRKGKEVFVIHLVADTSEFRVAIKVADDLFDRSKSPEVGEHLQVIRALVDEMEIISLPVGGQILKLVKQIAENDSGS